METLQRAFEPYRHYDPLGWVGLFRYLPVWAGLITMVLGALMMLFGGGKLFRVVAAPLGALIGMIWVPTVVGRLGISAPAQQVTLAAAITLAVVGVLFPPGVVFFAFGMPIGLIAAQLVGPTDWLLAFLPGFIIGGAVGIVLHTVVSSILSAAVGAWALVLGLLAVLNPFVGSVGTLAQTPVVVFAITACFAVAGAAYQLLLRGPPEELEKHKRERQLLRKKLKEDRALEKRWANYTKNSKKKGG